MRQVKGFPKYKVSKDGHVYSFQRSKKGKKLKKINHPKGYLIVTLYNNKEATPMCIHRIVAITYLGEPEKDEQVNHINGIKTDNRVENLEWVKCHENIHHAMELGTFNSISLSEKDVLEIRDRHKNEDVTQSDLAREYDVAPSHISNIIRRKRWAHI